MWTVGPPGRTTVAVEGTAVHGTANMYANRAGPGAHVASASFMVARAARGRRVGRRAGRGHARLGARPGSEAMQFNAVAETNPAAIALYSSLGFAIVGTYPRRSTTPSTVSWACT